MARRSMLTSAKLIAVCTLTSRITGLVRDTLLAQAFGLGMVQDAWAFAFQFPHLFRRLFGEGALAAAFVPTFTKVLDREGRPAAWQLLARTLAVLTVALLVLVILLALILLAVWLFSSGSAAELAPRRLTIRLMAIMLPFLLTVCVVALLSSILNCLDSFVPPALMPVFLNVGMILGIAWLAPALYPVSDAAQAHVIALVVVVAGIGQLLILWPVLRRRGVPLGWDFAPRDPHVRTMLTRFGPVVFGQGMLAVGVFIDSLVCKSLTRAPGGAAGFSLFGLDIAYPLETGALGAVTYAQRLYQFPLGVLIISLATVALPAFSRLAAREDWTGWRREVRLALRLALFEGLLAALLLVTLAESMIRLLFEYKEFNAADTVRAGHVLTFYGWGMWAFCAQHIIVRAFYSLGDVRTPVKITAGLLPLNLLLSLALLWVDDIREAAFAISSAITATLSVLLGGWLLRRRTRGVLLDRATVGALLRMLIAAAITCVALLYLRSPWQELAAGLPSEILSRAVDTLGLIGIGGAVYLLVGWVLRLREVQMIMPWNLLRAQRSEVDADNE